MCAECAVNGVALVEAAANCLNAVFPSTYFLVHAAWLSVQTIGYKLAGFLCLRK